MHLFHRAFARLLGIGVIPSHIAFIMDGNRRFARKRSSATLDGHSAGYEKLIQILEWSLELGVKACTVFAFSIENFKRPQEEVEGLMELAKDKFESMLNPTTESYRVIMQHKVRIRILGDCSLLPDRVQSVMRRVVEQTRQHQGVSLNICMSYTSQEEMKQVESSVLQGVQDGLLHEDDISEELVRQCLYTADCPEVDLLLRTSGETRLSDFLLYQTYLGTQLDFISPYWPELNFWRFGWSVWEFQWFAKGGKQERKSAREEESVRRRERDRELAIARIGDIAGGDDEEARREEAIDREMREIEREREQRIANFLRTRPTNAIV